MMHKQPDGSWIDSPISSWPNLYRTSYFVVPRLALEALPVEWQQRFIALMDEAEKLGMETPDYHVLRDGAEYTLVTLEDPKDEYSRAVEFYSLRSDPWSNYRHGNAAELQAEDKAAEANE